MLVLLCSSLYVIVATLIGGFVFDAGFIMFVIVATLIKGFVFDVGFIM